MKSGQDIEAKSLMFFYSIFGAFLRWTGPGEEALFCINNHVGKAKTQIVHRLTKFDHINIGLGHIISTLECNVLSSFKTFGLNYLLLLFTEWTGLDYQFLFPFKLDWFWSSPHLPPLAHLASTSYLAFSDLVFALWSAADFWKCNIYELYFYFDFHRLTWTLTFETPHQIQFFHHGCWWSLARIAPI